MLLKYQMVQALARLWQYHLSVYRQVIFGEIGWRMILAGNCKLLIRIVRCNKSNDVYYIWIISLKCKANEFLTKAAKMDFRSWGVKLQVKKWKACDTTKRLTKCLSTHNFKLTTWRRLVDVICCFWQLNGELTNDNRQKSTVELGTMVHPQDWKIQMPF